MRHFFTILSILFLLMALSSATVIHVPGDQPGIQAGIDAAADGDTVLVADNTYLENINFKGKAITVASHYLMDQDTSHISNTIIDGSQPSNADSGSVVSFVSGEDTTSVLYGFTITRGTGTNTNTPYNNIVDNPSRTGGGIFCYNAGARISSNLIKNNHISGSERSFGGGVSGFPIGSTAYIIIEANQIVNNSLDATYQAGGGGVDLTCNALVQNNVITHNEVGPSGPNSWGGFGGGLGCWTDPSHPIHIVIDKNHIRYNTVSGTERANGGGINLESGDFTISNNIINHNVTGSAGGGIYGYECNAQVINNTIVMNTALTGAANGGGVNFRMNGLSKVVIINSIIWGNQALENPQLWGLFLKVAHSNIEGEIWEGWGNITEDPAFVDTLTFKLSDSSPCISLGADSVLIADDWYYAPPTDRYNVPRPSPPMTTPDIGALENKEGFINAIENKISSPPIRFTLQQNYPNPFNPSTTINYELPITNYIELSIYNLLGQKVVTLISEKQAAGTYQVEWDATGFASGVYL